MGSKKAEAVCFRFFYFFTCFKIYFDGESRQDNFSMAGIFASENNQGINFQPELKNIHAEWPEFKVVVFSIKPVVSCFPLQGKK